MPGIGKTSMAAHVPGVVFLVDDNEDGITTLKSSGLVPNVPQLPPMSSWQETLDALDSLATEPHDFRAIAIDAIGGFEHLCHDHVLTRDYNGDRGEHGFGGYQRGAEVAVADWRNFINALDRLRDERQMSVFLLGHAKVGSFRNPEGPDYDRYVIDIHKYTWTLTEKWADIVLFANFEVSFTAKEMTKAKGKAKGGQNRMIYTEHHAAFDAKNRHNLPAEIEMGNSGAEAWSNFVNALKTAKEQK